MRFSFFNDELVMHHDPEQNWIATEDGERGWSLLNTDCPAFVRKFLGVKFAEKSPVIKFDPVPAFLRSDLPAYLRKVMGIKFVPKSGLTNSWGEMIWDFANRTTTAGKKPIYIFRCGDCGKDFEFDSGPFPLFPYPEGSGKFILPKDACYHCHPKLTLKTLPSIEPEIDINFNLLHREVKKQTDDILKV